MLIISQDKKTIINYDNIKFIKIKKNFNQTDVNLEYILMADEEVIAIYKSEEEALKELNQIEQYYNKLKRAAVNDLFYYSIT